MRRPVTLLPPIVTAIATFVGGACAVIAGAPAAAAATFHLANPYVTLFGERAGAMIPAAAALVSILATYVAGAGRSFIKTVDNPQPISGLQKP